MKIAIIGAGFTGLAASYQLTKKGHNVTIFERDSAPGGLALGYKKENWQWSLEKHYHHWFTDDKNILQLAKEIKHNVLTRHAKTSIYVNGSMERLDSPLDVLTTSVLSPIERLRMGLSLGLLKYNPLWRPLEKFKAHDILPKLMGDNPYKTLWHPQLFNKFGEFTNDISLAWFWARIKKRTASLSYPQEGFLHFANALVKKIKQNGGQFLFNTEVAKIESNKQVTITYKLKSKTKSDLVKTLNLQKFDAVVVTLPSFLFIKIAPSLPADYQDRLKKLRGLGATNLILRLKKPFLTDGTYWLSICQKNSPFVAIVEHTNFMDKKYYNNEHIVYVGNYVAYNHPYMKMTALELLKVYHPYLKKINPDYQLSIINYQLFSVPFAQPIIPVNYSKIIPPFETPLPNVYLANIQQVYPWDRGTNYAVELGEKIAKHISNSTMQQ